MIEIENGLENELGRLSPGARCGEQHLIWGRLYRETWSTVVREEDLEIDVRGQRT